MKILIVRHAKAEERRLLGLLRKDAARPLTPGGRKDMAKAAKDAGLKARIDAAILERQDRNSGDLNFGTP